MNKNSLIDPQYLLVISQQVETLNKFFEQEKTGALATQFKKTLNRSFSGLYQNINIYSSDDPKVDNSAMIRSSVIKCRAQLEIFCIQKLSELLKEQAPQISSFLQNVFMFYQNNVQQYETAILCERKQRLKYFEDQKDAAIERLKEQLSYKKKHIQELTQHIKQIEDQNSKIYKKMINTAKVTSEKFLSSSPHKNIGQLSATQIKIDMNLQHNQSHKTLTPKQIQQTILDIMETKQKQQNLKTKKISVNSFLKIYFRTKFGMKGLAQEAENNFREALYFFSEQLNRNIFLTFVKIINEECEEKYFWDQKSFSDKTIKIIKRYLNEKEGVSMDQLDKIYDTKIIDTRSDINLNQKDVQYILMNLYKTSQVDSLQMIFNQLILPHLDSQSDPESNSINYRDKYATRGLFIPSKTLLNEILNYQLKRHLFKIQDIITFITHNESGRGLMNIEELERALFQLNIPNQRIQANIQLIQSFDNKFLTFSQFIEVIEKIRKTKVKKKN